MATEFEKLKANRGQAFRELVASIQPTLGSHRSTRLKQAGCQNTRSLLQESVSASHAKLLLKDLEKFCQGDGAQDGFRFLTLLHAVAPLNCTEAVEAAQGLRGRLHSSISESGARCLGVVEFEVVNLELLRKIKSRSDDESRKLDVLEKLSGQSLATGVLVHLHGVMDFRSSAVDADDFRRRLLEVPEWKRSRFQVELKNFHRSQPLAENLKRIAAYITKGGNDALRYNPGFGRDPDSQLDAQIWRGPSGRADQGAERVPDERGLKIGEIQLLDQIWLRLMETRDDGRGYIVDLR